MQNDLTLKHAIIGIAEEHRGKENAIHINDAIEIIAQRTGLYIQHSTFREIARELFDEGYNFVSIVPDGFFMAIRVEELEDVARQNSRRFASGFRHVKAVNQRIADWKTPEKQLAFTV